MWALPPLQLHSNPIHYIFIHYIIYKRFNLTDNITDTRGDTDHDLAQTETRYFINRPHCYQ